MVTAIGVRTTGRIRGCERCRPLGPRSRDASGRWRQGRRGASCFGIADGTVRDRDAGSGREPGGARSEEHTSELQSLMRISYAVFCLKKKNKTKETIDDNNNTTETVHNTQMKQ